MNQTNIATETIELPSINYPGLIYSETNPLSKGKIEMTYMTSKQEDILTNQSYIADGTVLDRVIKSMIVTPINYDDLITGDKNALTIAARILGYGKDYEFEYNGEKQVVDLTTIENKQADKSKLISKGINEFEYTLPKMGVKIVYKNLTHKDDQNIQDELKALKKINKNDSREISTRLKYLILEVDGNRDKAYIKDFVDKHLIAQDSRALRKHIRDTQPDIELTFFPNGSSERVDIPIGIGFFYPEI